MLSPTFHAEMWGRGVHPKPAAVIMFMLRTVHFADPYRAMPVASLICANCMPCTSCSGSLLHRRATMLGLQGFPAQILDLTYAGNGIKNFR